MTYTVSSGALNTLWTCTSYGWLSVFCVYVGYLPSAILLRRTLFRFIELHERHLNLSDIHTADPELCVFR